MYWIVVLIHVLAVIVAVGTVTVTDYLHLVSLKKRKLEKQLRDIYPRLSRMVNFSLGIIFLTGISLVAMNPSLLHKSLFLLKISLVVLVTINGFYLQKRVSPHLDLCVLKGTKYCSRKLFYSTAISGSFSVVTWYAIVILSLTKNVGYSLSQFILGYLVVLLTAILISVAIELRAQKWRQD